MVFERIGVAFFRVPRKTISVPIFSGDDLSQIRYRASLSSPSYRAVLHAASVVYRFSSRWI
jgi:hypothetical protein